MKEVIELYAKMVIGTFAFIGPSFSLLIPIFYGAFERSKEKHQAKLKNLQALMAANLAQGEGDLEKKIKEGNRQLKKLNKENRDELTLLMPKRQMRRLFFSLILSIAFIAFYYFQFSHLWPYNNLYFRRGTVFASGLSFVYCLWVLWQVFCTVIKIKTEEETLKKVSRSNVRFRSKSSESVEIKIPKPLIQN